MSQGINREFIEDHYHRMDDDELLRAVSQDAHGLTPIAIEVIEAELKKRNLHGKASSAVAAQNRQHTIEEVDAYCALLQQLPCPLCGQAATKLNGGYIAEAASFLIVTTYSANVVIACPGCLDELLSKAQTKTALLGWWGFPWGPVRTLKALSINFASKKLHHSVTPNKYIRSFALGHIGEIEMYKYDREKLSALIS